MSKDSEDCWQCRIISGGGLVGAGAYVIQQAKKLKTSQRPVTFVGYGIGMLGLMRLLGLPPFRHGNRTSNDSENMERAKDNEYIIGKFSSKLN